MAIEPSVFEKKTSERVPRFFIISTCLSDFHTSHCVLFRIHTASIGPFTTSHKKVNLRSAFLTNEKDSAEQGTQCPFLHLSKDDHASPPSVVTEAGGDLFAADKMISVRGTKRANGWFKVVTVRWNVLAPCGSCTTRWPMATQCMRTFSV